MRWGVELEMRLRNRENESSSSKKVDLLVMIVHSTSKDFNRGEYGN